MLIRAAKRLTLIAIATAAPDTPAIATSLTGFIRRGCKLGVIQHFSSVKQTSTSSVIDWGVKFPAFMTSSH